ncbi:diguanylate cyclase/phosphodiesterase (GGDEF & EAL domains) with PAS/PAC sensor(s) [Candidatus Rhodobacter oscarellae]|uniref:histidine kinase n=1 Tax=Candidatus Rhodobacter oscarellae TaxID=1675527 RepID=A0A0J9E816_9RHOB|nr:diguanylate cyclase/phosphodiesterase (GGDEF & EAL domains) with PAS/PAC sensor(s) [Candidatus Rhodobacter lobularis]
MRGWLDKLLEEEREFLRRHCQRHVLDWLFRIVLLLVASSYFAQVLADPWYIRWWVAFAASVLVDYIAARRFSNAQTPGNYLLVILGSTLEIICGIVLTIYMWNTGVPALQFSALLYLIAAVMFGWSGRIRFLYAQVLDILMMQVPLTWFWMTIYFGATAPSATEQAVAIAFICIQAFHLKTLWSVRTSLLAIEAARQRAGEANKMDAVGRLTGGIAHDFNNILTVILGNLELHAEETDPCERDKLIRDAHTAAQRATALTSQLLTFSRQAPMQREVFAAITVAQELETMVRRTMPASVQFSVESSAGNARIDTDRAFLQSALLNLVINAADAMNGVGRIALRVRLIEGSATGRDQRDRAGFVGIAVLDNGPGFEDEALEYAFDPFFTTKPVGKGSGLGLSMVKGFAEQSGGTATARNLRGGGAEVELLLPKIAAAPP